MNFVPNIIGYHANDKEKCKNFVGKSIYIFSEDTYWLGYGMYFWDTFSNAVYWKTEKFRKHQYIDCVWIVKANILVEDILDLTDTEIVTQFEELWNNYSNMKEIEIAEQNEIPIGKKIDMMFDFYELKYKVIKCCGNYHRITDSSIFSNTKKCRITQKSKVIYSVRNKDAVKNQVFIEEYMR